MSHTVRHNLILGTLATLTVIALGVSISQSELATVFNRLPELVIFALLTAFALALGVPFTRGKLSVAHALGMIAFLSLPASVAPPMTVAIFLGGLIGGVIRAQQAYTQDRRKTARYATTIHITARVTLAFFISGLIYTTILNGSLPINNSADLSENAIPLTIYGLSYVLITFASFTLQVTDTYGQLPSLQRESVTVLVIIMLLPIPFAYMASTLTRTDESLVFFTITIVGLTLIIFGLYVLTRSQWQLRRQLEEMRSISIATQAMRGHLDLDGLLRTTYVQVSQLLDTRHFMVVLHDEIEQRMTFPLVIRNGEETTIPHNALPDDYPLVEQVLQNGQPLLIEQDVSAYAAEHQIEMPEQALHSWMGAPLMIGNQAIGAFVVQSFTTRYFNSDDLRLLNILVSSLSIAIENARLYRLKSSRAEQLATLNQVTALLTGTLSPNEVLDLVVSSASTISEAHAVTVYLFTRPDSDAMVLARHAGLSPAFTQHPPEPLLRSAILTSRDPFSKPSSLIVQNTGTSEIDLQGLDERLYHEGKRAFIEQPLVYSDHNVGVLGVYYNTPQSFSSEQINLLQAFCTQAAQAISNAQRFASTDEALEQRVEQLYVLAAMGRLLNASMETEKIYQVVLTYATDATKAPRGLIAVYRNDGVLFVPAQRGYPPDMFDDASYLAQGITGQVLKNGQPVRASDTRLKTGYLPLVPQTRSLLAIPIMKGQDVLGMILLEHDSPGAFSEGDSHFVMQIANQAVIATDNTLLFQRIREARDNMQVILDAMEEAIILIDGRGTITLANPHVTMLELTQDELLGRPVDALLADERLKLARRIGFSSDEALLRMVANIGSDWADRPPHHYDLQSEAFGIRYIQRQIIPVRDDHRTIVGILMVFYDKSEEQELAAARESLSQMIVHDLRSPLTAVTTSLRLLTELVPRDSDFAPIVDKTTSASRRAIRKVLNRVDSLLDISRMESGDLALEREPTQLHTVIENVRLALAPLADELDVRLVTKIEDNLPVLNVDPDKVERMVLNLVDNALKYSPEGSEVAVRATAITGEEQVRLEVIDCGPGIPDEYKTRLFERYVQVGGRKTVRRGVGLGLTFCKLVTEAHGGTITIHDNPAGGSIFSVTLPIT